MPAVIPFAKIIKPRLKVMNAESSFGLFHSILANSLNDWFNSIIPLQNGTATGAITTPAGYTFPFVYPALKANLIKMFFSALRIKMCAFGGGEDFYPKLFNYIGQCINQQILSWSTNPISMTGIPNPINLIGAVTPGTGFITTHFYNVGLAYKNLMRVKQPDAEDVFDYTWDQFELKLKFAINTIPPLVVAPTFGSTPAGIFNGLTTVKLVV